MDNELRQLIVEGDELGIDRYLALRDERVFDKGEEAGRFAAMYAFNATNPFRQRRLAEEGR